MQRDRRAASEVRRARGSAAARSLPAAASPGRGTPLVPGRVPPPPQRVYHLSVILPDPTTLWLLVALLLALWLLTRVRSQAEPPPPRKAPVTLDELGRSVFAAVRNTDFSAYRELFLAGSETRAVLGAGADAYLDRRTRERLAEALAALRSCLPEGCHYRGFLIDEGGQAFLEAQMADGAVRPVLVGSVIQVGVIWRLVDPPGGPG